MRRHRAVDVCTICYTLEDTLNRAGRHANGVMDGKMSVYEWAHTVGEGNNAALCLRAVGAAFTVDHEPVVLPVNLIAGESGQLGNS